MRRILLLVLLLALPAATHAANLAVTPIDRLDLPWWQQRWEMTLQQAHDTPDAKIIWLGDSITQNWQFPGKNGWDSFLPVWQQYYAPYQALDFGFKGDTTSSLIWRLDHGQVTGLHPQLTIILIGANNFGRLRWDAAMTIPGIETVVTLTQQKLPHTHILLLGVLPSIRSPWVDQQTLATNAALARDYAGNHNVTFINLSPLFMKDGKVDPTCFVDLHLTPPNPPLHPTAQTMARMAQQLQPYVAEYVK
jgi:lysophospholipase L1-like esterase